MCRPHWLVTVLAAAVTVDFCPKTHKKMESMNVCFVLSVFFTLTDCKTFSTSCFSPRLDYNLNMSDFIPDIKATSDAVVHFLFTSPGNEDLLLSFINAVLVDAGQPPVVRVTVRNPLSTKNFLHEKDSILDIKAEDEQGRTFTIEFQIAEQEAFMNRILYYWAKCYSGQLLKGNQYESLLPVVSIAVVEFPLFPELKKLHNTFCITSVEQPEYMLTEDLRIHTLELTKEKWSQIPTLSEPLRGWMEFLYLSNKKTEKEMKVLLKRNPPAERAYDEYRHFSQELLDRDREISRDMFHHDQVSREFSARRKVLLSLLAARFGEIPETIQERVKKERFLEKLDDLIVRAGTCQSLDEFAEALT